jgi:hypothetical protein
MKQKKMFGRTAKPLLRENLKSKFISIPRHNFWKKKILLRMPKYWIRNSLKERDDIFNNKLNDDVEIKIQTLKLPKNQSQIKSMKK